MVTWFESVLCWLRAHDVPNWIAIPIWPFIVILWQRRHVNSIPGLEVHFLPDGELIFAGGKHKAVTIQFTNHTGCVAYISGARIRSITKNFPVPHAAARDIGRNLYHLKFLEKDGVRLDAREITLQTTESASTGMPVDSPAAEFFGYVPPWYRRLFCRQKFLVLEYTAMVSSRRYLVATLY
jgi:hypothetical protein